MQQPFSFVKTFDWLSPLPIPDVYKRKAFKASTSQQLFTALILNVLSLAVPIMMLQVYDRIIPHQSYGTLSLLTLGVLVALVCDGILRILRSWLIGWTAATNEYVGNCAALNHLNRSNLIEFEKRSPGEYIQDFGGLSRLREFYSGQTVVALIDLPFAAIFLVLIAYLGGVLVLVPVTLLTCFFICASLIGFKLRDALEMRHVADDKKSSVMLSILQGIHSVKALGLESSILRKYEHAQRYVTNGSYHVAMASGKASTLGAAFGQLSLILTAGAGAVLVVSGYLSIGGLSACTLLAGRAIQPIQRVLGTWIRLQDLSIAKAQAKSLFAVPARQGASRQIPRLSGKIILDKVTFGYDDEAPLFKNISLEVKPGRAITIEGGKGSGKSSLLQVMAGVLPVSAGRVLVDDIDTSQFNLSDFNGQIGYLPQQGMIFRGTILENITGFRNDEFSIQSAKEIALDLGLDSIIDFLPYGYQTMLTDTVADPIPPGIKQRIALARVLVRRPSVLLFDDADRALDKEGYNKLFRIMGRLKGRCTMILVSHDHNLLSFSDETYQLEDEMLEKVDSSGSQNISHISFS